VLALGRAYLSSLNIWEVAQALMEDLVEQTGESCSAATLDLPDIVYVARVPTRRIMSITLGVGTRLPAHATSMGRVLLAELPEDDLDDFLATSPLHRLTERTTVHPAELRALIVGVRADGWAMVDQELELGLRSVAAPIRDAEGRTVAALNLSAAASRVPVEQLQEEFLPALLRTAGAISTALGRSSRPAERSGPVVSAV
jgi:IclR family pca regulon transcriptional regulator